MSKAIKRTAADSTDAETTRVIQTGAFRVDDDANRTEVIVPSRSADSERTNAIDDDVFRPDTEKTQVVDDREFEEERRRRELAEQRARERADRQAIEAERQRRAAYVEPEPQPVVAPAPKRTTDKAMASLGMFLFRIVVGGILGVHGFQHLIQRDLTLGAVQALPLPSGYDQVGVWVLGICECVAAVCIILGLLTRIAGAGLTVIMVLALVFIFWGNFAIFKTMGFKGELELVLAGCGVLLLFLGAGGWSIDAAYRRSRAARKAEEAGY
ncbi:DoxX family protein [Cutibacterium sp.]|uniref:DoxX family protein n=1 Tax=Cutibacterium sp. TaxID=1912221 RepID=UPI0026DCB746|nr:DoxX family protein [Cutibacterium sp.]MDO4412736.1 DoxX family protein [Cutibacterium sp.]